MSKKPIIVLASTNQGKLREIQEIFSELDVEFKNLSAYPGCPISQENFDNYLENAREKASLCAEHTGHWVLADDSGLEIDALQAAPGVHSARFAGEGASDVDNIAKVLQLLQGEAQRSARFRCCVVLRSPQGEEYQAEGLLEGEIASAAIGSQGFGYDPIFYLPDLKKSLAQLSQAEKNSLSHRRKALEKIRSSMLHILQNN